MKKTFVNASRSSLLVAALALSLGIGQASSFAQSTATPAGPGVKVMAAGQKSVANYSDIDGVVEAVMQSTLSSQIPGRVLSLNVKAGDRVAYAGKPAGAYSQVRVMPAEIVVKLPDAISFEMGAAMMLQGLTVNYLLTDSYKVQAGDTVLFHAAAGGVGLIAMQWLKLLGATVIGTVGSEEKAALAKSYGCDHTILYTKEDFVARTKELTNGKGVNVVYDSIGKDTFMQSLDCIKPRGMMVTLCTGSALGKSLATTA